MSSSKLSEYTDAIEQRIRGCGDISIPKLRAKHSTDQLHIINRIERLNSMCTWAGIYLDGESPSWGLSSQWSTTSRTPRVSAARRNLKEGVDKTAT